jgi:class 3 adenylate cyclase/tetratricopeptide (TPR) repeat protein
MERRLAAILAADVVGYSRLVGRNEAGTLAALKAHRQELIEGEIASRGGRIIKLTGDGMLVEFASVVAAVECAAAIQVGIAERNRGVPPDERIEFRIGVNLDEVIADGADILGDGVNIAARLEAFAEPGSVCISSAVFNQVKNRVGYAFADLGMQRFKNIAEPVHVFRLDPTETSDPTSRPAGGAAVLPPSEKPSIAILPFANLSGDPEQDYLAEGLRLDIQATLVHASGLFLIAPATVARYRGGATTADQAGRELGVRYVLQGAVRRSGGRIRVTAELTDVIARQIVWAERYDRVLQDGFDVQDEIVAEVLKGLDVRLASGERWLLHNSIGSLQALDVFYRALSRFYAGTKDDNAAAREAFEALARLQPDSAVGPAYLCFTHWVDAFRGWTDSKERSLAEAEAWAKKSVSIRGDNGLPHIVLASVHLLNRRHDEALAECYRAVQLRPNCPTANCYLANLLHYCGRSDEAIARVQEAIRITPVYPPWYLTVLAAAYRDSGEFEQSIAAAERGLGMSPGDRDLKLVLCSAFSLAGQPQRARPLVREVVAAEPAFSVRSYLESQAYQDAATLQRLAESLRQAGLPE